MISPYAVTSDAIDLLLEVIARNAPYELPNPVEAIQQHMGPPVFACSGTIVSVTNVTPKITEGAAPNLNCTPDAQYAVDVTIARDCAIEFSDDGQTVDAEADRIAQELSRDASILWETYALFQPQISWQITGGLGLTTATFTTAATDYPVPIPEVVHQVFASDSGGAVEG